MAKKFIKLEFPGFGANIFTALEKFSFTPPKKNSNDLGTSPESMPASVISQYLQHIAELNS